MYGFNEHYKLGTRASFSLFGFTIKHNCFRDQYQKHNKRNYLRPTTAQLKSSGPQIPKMNSAPNSTPLGNSSDSQTKKISNMSQVPTPEVQIDYMANDLTDKKPIGFLDLPYEIRLIIYRRWFSRPIGIVPGVNYYTRSLTYREKTETEKRFKRYPAYRYQWEGAINSQNLPSRYGEPRSVFPSEYCWALG
jgi:hypothetical protein